MTLQFNSYKLGWKKLALLQDCGSQLIVCVCVCGISGGWSSWGNWGECSTECGGGVQTRTRVCQSPPEEAYLCAGVLEEGHPCNPQPCIGEFCSVCVIADGFVLLHSSFSCLFSFPIFLSPATLSRCTLYNFWSDFAVIDKNHIQKIFCSWVENGGLRRHNVTFTGTDFSATVTKDSWNFQTVQLLQHSSESHQKEDAIGWHKTQCTRWNVYIGVHDHLKYWFPHNNNNNVTFLLSYQGSSVVSWKATTNAKLYLLLQA